MSEPEVYDIWMEWDRPMSEQIEPGEGWRLLGPDETVRDGDEFFNFGEWQLVVKLMTGEIAAGSVVRRRIPAKPEAMEIDGHRVSLDNGFMRIGSLFSHYYFSSRTEAIRKLGEWCISVADWREAQGDSK